jgi:hypothetical protein
MNKNRKEILKQASLNYRQNLKKSLEIRLESARVAGDEKLIRQLEAEANYLHLN